MRRILTLLTLAISTYSIAQDPEDALRLGYNHPLGTARSNAIGGAMGSLGGDMSASSINPAGLGFYNKGEIYFSPYFSSKSNDLNYFGNRTNSTDGRASIGAFGFVFNNDDNHRKSTYKSKVFSITYTKLADYNNTVSFRSQNNYSSYLEKFADQLYYDGASEAAAKQNYIYGSSLAYNSNLITPVLNNNGDITDYKANIPITNGLNQFYDAKTKGSMSEMNFSWAGNLDDKLYLGASIVMPMVNFSRSLEYGESISNGNNPVFDFTENFNSKGFGLGAKLGLIYKVQPSLRLGFSIHTPQVMTFNESYNAVMYSNAYPNGLSSYDLMNMYKDNYYPSGYTYNVTTPMKSILSASYFFAAPSTPTTPLGFVSADVEFVNYAGIRYYSTDNDASVINYYSDLNQTIKNLYTNAVNLRLGSEVRLNKNWLLRAGAAVYSSPYKDKTMDAGKLVGSGGIGYRIGNQFIDLTLMNIYSKDAIFPYRLTDKDSYYATQNSNHIYFSIGYGIKF